MSESSASASVTTIPGSKTAFLWCHSFIESLSTGGIVRIIVGLAVVVVIWGVVYIWLQRRKARQELEESGVEEKQL